MTRRFLHTIESFLAEECQVTEPQHLLVGLSGGADSMALLDVLRRLGHNCLPVHFNFGLRGEESRRDEDFVRQFCQNQGLRLIVENLPARAYAEANHLSIEMAARELRYRRFEELRQQEQADYLAVGHHSDDDLETFFLNLLRGSGPKGLCGIRPRNGSILRPLLCVSHEEILHYLKHREISHITDSSNLSTEFRRNRLRLELLPLLESVEPAARQNIARSIHLLKESERLYGQRIAEDYSLWTDKSQAEVCSLEQSPVAEGLFHRWLTDFGFSSASICQIWENRHGQSGQIHESATHRLLLDRGTWRLEPKSVDSQKEAATSEVILIQKDDSCVESPLLENARISFTASPAQAGDSKVAAGGSFAAGNSNDLENLATAGDVFIAGETLSAGCSVESENHDESGESSVDAGKMAAAGGHLEKSHIVLETNWMEVPKGQNPMDLLSRQPATLCIDASKLIFPLQLRLARPGDRFRPFGMHGSRLLSDFLTDLKCSRFDKERCLVLCNGDDGNSDDCENACGDHCGNNAGEIIWVVGRRSSQTFAVHPGSRWLYQASLRQK